VYPDKPAEREVDVLQQSLQLLTDRLPSTWTLVDVTTEVRPAIAVHAPTP
jgi:hypothetical protein